MYLKQKVQRENVYILGFVCAMYGLATCLHSSRTCVECLKTKTTSSAYFFPRDVDIRLPPHFLFSFTPSIVKHLLNSR